MPALDTTPSAPAVNEEAARRFFDNDVEVLQSLVVAYLQQAPALPDALNRAARQEPGAFQRELMRLRGACRMLFAEGLLSTLDQVEAAIKARHLSRRKAVAALLPELGRLEQALKTLRPPLERELGWKVML